jgi:putative hydrolase of the HAD superfamily
VSPTIEDVQEAGPAADHTSPGGDRVGPAASRGLLRGVITDWGGVLTSPIPDSVRSWLDADGIDHDSYVSVIRPWLGAAYAGEGNGQGNPVHALERGECTPEEFEQLLASQIVRLDGGRVAAEGLLARMFAAALPSAAMHDLLRQLRAAGVRTSLLSNSWGAGDYPRDLFPVLFDAVVISAEVGMRKPEERIFRHTAARIGLAPEECVFIDDIEANVAAAEAIGMTGVLHTEPGPTAAHLAGLLGIPLG